MIMATYKTKTIKSSEIAEIALSVGNNPIFSTFNTTANNYHRGYDFNGRQNKESKIRWDCSELSAFVQTQKIKDLKSITDVNWKTDFNKLSEAFKAASTTFYQRDALDKMNVPKITGKNTVMNAELKPGMLIYLTYPPRAGSQYSGHVATVTRDPETGKLMISESIGGKNNVGVIHRDVKDFFTKGYAVNHPRASFALYDPYYKDRPILDKMDKEAQNIRNYYNEADLAFKNGGNNGFRKVGGNSNANRMDFIKNYVENKLEPNQPALKIANNANEFNMVNENRFNNVSTIGQLAKKLVDQHINGNKVPTPLLRYAETESLINQEALTSNSINDIINNKINKPTIG